MPEADLEWSVPAALDGERVDRALAVITGLSRSQINAILEGGRVAVGRRVVTARSRRVHTGEKLTVEGDIEPGPPDRPSADPAVTFTVVHDDADVIVVDKPPGLVVHPGNGNRTGTLVHGLLARYGDLEAMATGEQVDRPGIVHRLDKGTSGLLVVARNPAARDALIAQLSSRTMGRGYAALVFGSVEAEAGVIDAPLGRSDIDPSRIRVQAGGRVARTRYEVERRFSTPASTTLVRCALETGRTHQIRVHLSSIGHPVVGDDRYGGGRRGRVPHMPPGRPFLHAGTLRFVHPATGEDMSFTSPLAADLAEVLSGLS